VNLRKFFVDLEKRDLISGCSYASSDDFLKLNSSEKIVYFGIDCTGNSLHIGHLFSFFQLIRFAKEEFKILIILGGLTSKIGDPSDKLKERPQLSSQEINSNLISIKKQINNLLFKKRENINFPFAPLQLFFADNSSLLNSIYKILNFQGNTKEEI
jgi:tyrosyl-tRNA synthetase